MPKQFTDRFGDDLYIMDPSSVTAVYTDWVVLDNPWRLVHGTTIVMGSEHLFVKESACDVREELAG